MRTKSTSCTLTKNTDHDCKLSRKVYFYTVTDKRLLIIFPFPVVFISFNLCIEKQNKRVEARMIWDTEERDRENLIGKVHDVSLPRIVSLPLWMVKSLNSKNILLCAIL